MNRFSQRAAGSLVLVVLLLSGYGSAMAKDATLTNIKGFLAKKPDLTITIDRDELEQVMMGAISFDEQIKNGKAKLKGDSKPYEQLKGMLVQFDLGFEILPGTAAKDLIPESNTFKQEPVEIRAVTD